MFAVLMFTDDGFHMVSTIDSEDRSTYANNLAVMLTVKLHMGGV